MEIKIIKFKNSNEKFLIKEKKRREKGILFLFL